MCEETSVSVFESENVSSELHNSNKSEHSLLYKAPVFKNTQADRRNQLLECVKARRNASINEKRGISELFINNEEVEEPMEVVDVQKKVKRKYANRLMLSEYLLECPEDLESFWLFKCCPVGVRNLVVAHRGITKSFNKSGVFITEFPSKLPGGNRSSMMASKFTILDCVYNADQCTYYILDILAWNSYSLLNCSSEFRFFFLKSKLDENMEIRAKTSDNRFSFVNTASYPAQFPLIEECLRVPPCDSVELDGILFYHADVDYRAGTTPLVGWLQPFMVPEILKIPVHPDYHLKRPEDYTNLQDHIEKSAKHQKKKRKITPDVEMAEEVFNC